MRSHSSGTKLAAEEGNSENDMEAGGVQRTSTTRKPSKCKIRRNFVKEYLIDYAANSNLHGLKYIGEKDRTIVEEVFWFLMFACCVVFCSVLINKVWNKWDQNPVIVSFAENTTPVFQIPHPAVSVCFETKAVKTKFNYTESYNLYYNTTNGTLLSEKERILFEDISMVCQLPVPMGRNISCELDTVKNIIEVSPNMSEQFFICYWKGSTKTCKDLFSPILTEEGLCYTFNTLCAEELKKNSMDYLPKNSYLGCQNKTRSWSLEDGYGKSEPIETYPHRGSGYIDSGLTFILEASGQDLDYMCRGAVQGFKILLHNPAELPRFSQQYFRVPLAQEVLVAVKPVMMTTSEGLKPYSPFRRQCFFPNERYLRYFKVYTQANCEMECLSNFTYTRCGCVHFGMPHGPGMNICNSGSIECIQKSRMELATIEIQSDFDQSTEDSGSSILHEPRKVAAKCKCLQSCVSIKYEAHTSQADFDWWHIFTAFRKNFKNDSYYSRVTIFLKDAQFIPSRRSELFGPTDFLAYCGGLLGLLMGFSVLSVAEIIYFLTLRLCCKYWRPTSQKRE